MCPLLYTNTKDDNIDKLFDRLGDAIRDGAREVIELIDLEDDKRTIINFNEIASFGYDK